MVTPLFNQAAVIEKLPDEFVRHLQDKLSPEAIKTLLDNAERCMKRAQQGKSGLQKLTRAFCKEVGISTDNVVPGPVKSPERILLKAYARYEGQVEKVADVCRLQIKAETLEELRAVRAFMKTPRGRGFFDVWAGAQRDIMLEKFDDFFEKPTKDLEFRAFDYKFNMYLGYNRFQRAEIQIIHAGMSETYETTHKILEEVRQINDLLKVVSREITDEEQDKIKIITQEAKDLHFGSAFSLGVTSLQSPGSAISPSLRIAA